MPLQSGSDRILRLMARRTRRDSFRALVAAARAQIPDLSLSTDLIAGFPGETEADFQETVDVVEEIAFSRLHVFTYSARPGTAAAQMGGQLPKAVRKARTQQLIALGERLSLAFHQSQEGQRANVLWEMAAGANGQGLRWQGYTDNYIRVTAFGPADLLNRVAPARLHGARDDGMEATLFS